TFSLRKWRQEAARLAEDLDANVLFLECVCSRDTILERLARRRQGEDGQSDARPEHLDGLVDEFESMDELSPERHARINTEDEIEANLRSILSGSYIKKRAQVEKIIAGL
ncbi:MAG TPA: AAA family ATPase, partial [Syntrophobacteraceae bacterium]|nr:AAA family ATPase [Syntrophobacteraceae bacterium]